MPIMVSLQGKVAIITGGGSGFGYATAKALAAEGCHIVTGDMNPPSERGWTNLRTDVRNEADIESLVQTALEKHPQGVDIFFANAGLGWSGPMEEMTVAQWQRLVDTNLTGLFLSARAIVPVFKRQRRGYLVNTASGLGKRARPNFAAYCATKFGVVGFSEALALELSPFNIKVTALCPGPAATRFGENTREDDYKGNYLSADDVAAAVVFVLKQSDIAWIPEIPIRPM